jgi:argininosuccinate synthase
MTARVVFAFSGAAEAWAAIAAAAAARGAEIVTLTLDLGQGTDLEEVRRAALASGAVRAHVLDVREEFAREYVLPALHAGALHDGDPMAVALAQRLIQRKLAEIAAIEQAEDAVDVSGLHANLWGRVGSSYTLTKSPGEASDLPADVEIAFERGVPTAINGVPMGLTELIEILAIIAGHHAVGRIAIDGMCGEAPAAVVLVAAYTALAGACQPKAVTGAVRLKLLKGDQTVIAVDPAPGSRIPAPGSPLRVRPS